MKTKKIFTIVVLAVVFGSLSKAAPMDTAFTYQGRLIDANKPADGFYDFQFKLFDVPIDGNQVGSDVNKPEVDVIDGYFTVELNFGRVFDGDKRWLEIGVRSGNLNDLNAYITLSPRQEVTPTPYALHTYGLSLVYDNTFVGKGAGKLNTTGVSNTFSGFEAGLNNSTGRDNTYLGNFAGSCNPTGNGNTLIGSFAGALNLDGSYNTFLGYSAGCNIAFPQFTGSGNVFIGYEAGYGEHGSNKLYIANSSADASVIICGDFDTGRVGLGTTAPEERLHVKDSGYLQARFESTNSAAGIRLISSDDQQYELQSLNDGGFIIYDRSDSRYCIAIDTNGNVGIGTTSPSGFKLAVNGSAAKPGGGSWSVFSDRRLKKVGDGFERGLSEVIKLNPVRYSYRDDNELDLPAGKEFVGLVAQEVWDIVPEAIEENDNGYLMLDNDPIIWTMVNAIKELKAENESLKDQLKRQSLQVQQRVEALEKTIQQIIKAKEVQLSGYLD